MDSSRPRIAESILTLGSSAIVRIIFGFLGLIVATRVIPKEDLGVYFLIFAIVASLEVIGGLGLGQSVAKFVASAPGNQEQKEIVNNILTFRLITMLVLSILAIVCKSVFIRLFHSDLLASLFLFVPLLYCVQSADLMLDYILQGFQLFRKMAFIRILNGALNFALVLLFLLVMNLGVKGYILAAILSLAFTCFLRYLMIPTVKVIKLEPKLLRRIIRFGLPLQGNDILTYISDKLDILIVGAFLRPTAVGYLGIAKKIPENLQRVSNSLHTVYFPHMCNLFSEGQKSKAEEVMNRFLRLTSFIAAFGALIVVLFQRDIITLVFSEKYIPSAPAFGLLMVIFILIVASTILDYTLVAAGHPDYLPIISLADTGPSLLANLVLIPIFGFMGAVYAKLIANILTNPVSVWALLREKIGVRLSTYLKPIFLLLICLAVYFGLGWDTVVVKGFLIVLFVVLSAFFSLVTKRDISGLLKVLTLRFPKTVVNK